MGEERPNWFKLDMILDQVIALYSDEEVEDPSITNAHSHTESKLDKAFRLIDTYGIPYEGGRKQGGAEK